MKKEKIIDLFVTFLIFICWSAVSFAFSLPAPAGFGLSMLLPAVYLMAREKKNLKKIFFGAFIFGVFWGFIIDFIEVLNKAWVPGKLLFPWKIFGVVPVDDILGLFFMALFMLVFYEHFIDEEKNKKISKNLIFSLIPPIIGLVAIYIISVININILVIPYTYLWGGIVEIITLVAIIAYKPKLFLKLIYITIPFFFIGIVVDVIAIKTGEWFWLGQYVGTVSVLGFSVPFEEFFFWIIACAPSIVAYYELFVDDLS